MDYTSLPLKRLAEQFERMPGVGKVSAQRMAFYVLGLTPDEAKNFADAITDAVSKLHRCSICQNLTEHDTCPICENIKRNKSIICVVGTVQDLMAVEKTGEYDGVYHVLHGEISPLNGIGPDDLTIKELLNRVKNEAIDEIILATNSDTEGETTAMYIQRLLKPFELKVTRPAYGIPVGMELQYADNITLGRAIEGRQIF
ncbi:MAG TPA: recombination protein RecR [Clostridiales bacterium]|nr:recombination protein RecR [Clostridiales bacterium]